MQLYDITFLAIVIGCFSLAFYCLWQAYGK